MTRVLFLFKLVKRTSFCSAVLNHAKIQIIQLQKTINPRSKLILLKYLNMKIIELWIPFWPNIATRLFFFFQISAKDFKICRCWSPPSMSVSFSHSWMCVPIEPITGEIRQLFMQMIGQIDTIHLNTLDDSSFLYSVSYLTFMYVCFRWSYP